MAEEGCQSNIALQKRPIIGNQGPPCLGSLPHSAKIKFERERKTSFARGFARAEVICARERLFCAR